MSTTTATTIAKYIERFRYQEPLPAEQRNLFNSQDSRKAFWWLDDAGEKKPALSEIDDDSLSDDGTVSTEDSLNRFSQTHSTTMNEQIDGLKFSYSNLYLLNSHDIDTETLSSQTPLSPSVISTAPLNVHHLTQNLPLDELDHKAEALFELCDKLLEDFQRSEINQQPLQEISASFNSDLLPSHPSEDENDNIDLHSCIHSKDDDIEMMIKQVSEEDVSRTEMEVNLENWIPIGPPRKVMSPKSEKIRASELSATFYLSSDDEEMLPSTESVDRLSRSLELSQQNRAIPERRTSFELLDQYSSDDILQQLFQQYQLKQKELLDLRKKLQDLIT